MRGSSGSLTRTMMRNIMLMSAKAVTTITTKRRMMRNGSNGFGTPAMIDPISMIANPARTALIVPDMLNPAISSSLVIGVTR